MSRYDAESSTAKVPSLPTREALNALSPLRRLPGRNVSKADVCVVRLDARLVAVKDYAARPWLARNTAGRWLVRRECRAYRAAGPVQGLARFLGRIDAFALATEWIEATPLADLAGGFAEDAIFDRLDGILAELHARGIAIADLHHRDVLVGAGGTVHVVDLAAAHVLGPRPGPVRRRVFARLTAQDRLAAARMRARFTGRSEDDALAALDPAAVRLWGLGRRVKALWDRLRGKRG